MNRAFLSVGSNIRRRRSIKTGLRALYDRYGPLRCSPVYETAAVGFRGPTFYNLVVSFVTVDAPSTVVDFTKTVELACGREPRPEKFHSRTLDLDLLLYGDRISKRPPLPRPDIFAFAFVLQPLAELAPDRICPGRDQTFSELWAHSPLRATNMTSRCVDWLPVFSARQLDVRPPRQDFC